MQRRRSSSTPTLLAITLAVGACNDSSAKNGRGGAKSPATLVVPYAELPGARCPSGGLRLDVGFDADADGALSASEITEQQYVCDSSEERADAAGHAVLIVMTDEPAGSNCPSGGARVVFGSDENGDGVLDEAEVNHVAYECGSASGTGGRTILSVVVSEPPGGNCASGGLRIDSGADGNGNLMLDGSEVGSTQFICNGPPNVPANGRHLRKVAVVIYDPINSTDGRSLLKDRGWVEPDDLDKSSDELASGLRTATGGHVDFQIVARYRVHVFPIKADGFRYSWASFQACMANDADCHRPDDVAFEPLMRTDTGVDLCAQINDGTIDEVWVWGFDYSGFDEFAFKIPGDRAMYATSPYNPWIYDLRMKDLPDCGRTYFVMGFNAVAPGGNALHSIGHRAESAMTISPAGRGTWGDCDGTSEWADFSCSAKGRSIDAGCGNIHFPPNGRTDYDYDDARPALSYCDDYANYPSLTKATQSVNVRTWSPKIDDTQWDYLLWWFAHVPRATGSHEAAGETVSNDWWNYILCYDGDCPLTP